MIKLQREHGNPLLGCLPTVLQIPLFLALYRVMNGFEPQTKAHLPSDAINGYYPDHLNGLSVHEAYQIAHAKIFGASLATTINSSQHALDLLGASATSTRILCAILIVVMMVTTYITQRQIIGRNAVAADAQQAMTQKLMLYASPIGLGIFSLRVSIGGLLYYFTSNLWSMGQQLIVIRRMPPVIPGTAGGVAGAPVPAKPAPMRPGGLFGGKRAQAPLPAPEPQRRLIQQRAAADGGPATAATEEAPAPAAIEQMPAAATTPPTRPPRGGSASKRKKGRRGGRR